MKTQSSKHYPAALALAGLLLAAAPARAQTRTITLNTGLLNGASTFYLDFSLFNGGGPAGDGNSTAVVSGFSLMGGTLGTVLAPTTGDVTGDLGSTLTLRDDNAGSSGAADFAQAFTVNSSSSTLTFNLNLSASSVDAAPPDDFQFQILDSAQKPLATNGPTGVELVNANYNSKSPVPLGFTTQSTSTLAPGTVDTDFPGIKATVTNAPVPEAFMTASFGLLLTLGLGGLALSARLRKTTLVR